MEKVTLSYSVKTKGDNKYLYLEKRISGKEKEKKTLYLGAVDDGDERVKLIDKRNKIKAELRALAEIDASKANL